MTKNEIKYIQCLSDKKNRDSEKKFVVEGPKMLEELLKSDFEVEKIWMTDIPEDIPSTIPCEHISSADMARISQLKTPSTLLALVAKPSTLSIKEMDEWTIVLDGIQDPGNMGTIIRIADWFGISQIVASLDTADCFNGKVVQSTMGGIFRVKIWYTDIVQYLETTKMPIYGALLNGANVYQLTSKPKGILVIGNESKGIRPNIQPFIQKPITIPRIGLAESLNAAVATGIIVGELTR
ncbi:MULTISPECIES: TrmH family RNA methyltransferase [Chitinophagaceae]